MALDRGTLAKVDRRLLSELDHTEGVQLVKVPVSDATWATWRRYCEALGIPMGRGLAILLEHELASVVGDMEERVSFLEEHEQRIAEREAELAAREEALTRREADLAQPKTPPGPPDRKMGRNEQCWCESGRKYKICHGRQA